MKKKVLENKRYFASCIFCKTKYDSHVDIEPCCTSIVVNDRKNLRSIYKTIIE